MAGRMLRRNAHFVAVAASSFAVLRLLKGEWESGGEAVAYALAGVFAAIGIYHYACFQALRKRPPGRTDDQLGSPSDGGTG